MLSVLGITIFIIRSILRGASRKPDNVIDETFQRKYGYLVEDLRSVGHNTNHKEMII